MEELDKEEPAIMAIFLTDPEAEEIENLVRHAEDFLEQGLWRMTAAVQIYNSTLIVWNLLFNA